MKKYIKILILALVPTIILASGTVRALEIYTPPSIFLDTPHDAFTEPKHWMYYSEDRKSYIIQAYLPGYSRDEIEFEIKETMRGGYSLSIDAARWKGGIVLKTGLIGKRLITFGKSVNLPDGVEIDKETSSYRDSMLTIMIPSGLEEIVKDNIGMRVKF